MYKAIITYNFTDDDIRNSFVELLKGLRLINHPDQSTYALKQYTKLTIKTLQECVINWSEEEHMTKGDSVQIYFAAANIANDKPTIKLYNLKYYPTNRALRLI